MSYDIWLEADLGGPEPVVLAGLDWNYTSNVAPMWRAAGVDLAGFHGLTAAEGAALLRPALAEQRNDPERFRPMNPANGWGSYEGLIEALDVLLAELDAAPAARIVVSH